MGTIILAPTKSAIIDDYYTSYNDHTSTECIYGPTPVELSAGTYFSRRLVCGGYPSLTTAQSHKKILLEHSRIGIYLTKRTWLTEEGVIKSDAIRSRAMVLNADFTESSITYATLPSLAFTKEAEPITSDTGYSNAYFTHDILGSSFDWLKKAVNYGVVIAYASLDDGDADSYAFAFTSGAKTSDAAKIYVYLEDDDNEIEISACSPSSGYVAKYEAKRFSWLAKPSGVSFDELSVVSNTFKWRVTGSSTINTISCGTNQYCDIPANTFSDDSIDWAVAVVDSNGNTTTSEWYTISTAEATSTATAISPKNVLVDNGVNTIPFEWTHNISTGTLPTGADLQRSSDGVNWTTFATLSSSSATTYTAPLGTFTSGQWYWRVRTYNTDSTAGTWSDKVSFMSASSPIAPQVSAEYTPRPTITWQVNEQQGYEIVVDDESVCVKFGTSRSFKLPYYLSDGTHVIKVRVQNTQGLWSSYGETSIVVSNTAGSSITVTCTDLSGVAYLAWTQDTNYDAFVVYRNGVAIAKTTDTSYTDYLANGDNIYLVRGIYSSSDNYGLSDALTVNISASNMSIVDVTSKTIVKLPLSTSSIREMTTTYSQTYYSNHYAGADFPEIEASRYKDERVSVDAGFRSDDESANALVALHGRVVCLKTMHGDSIIGLLTNLSRKQSEFITSYTFTLSKMHYDEEVEI